MTALIGRNVFIRKGSGSPQVLLSAGRSKTIKMNGTAVDITSDDDSGYRTLLEADAGLLSCDISFEGVVKDANFLNQLAGGNFVDDYEIEIQGIGVLNGRFFITAVELSAPHNEAAAVTCELQSTGAFSFNNTDSP